MKTAIALKGTDVKLKVKLHNLRWPRSGHQSGDFAIAIFDVLRVFEGEVPDECLSPDSIYKYQIAATGKMPKLDNHTEYILTGTLEIDKNWGPQYKLTQLRLDYDLSRPEDIRKFFSYFMTDNQIDKLLDSGENPVEWLENKNIGKLTSIKGVGPVTASRMIVRYEECKDYGRAYVALKAYELTKNAIDKLVKHYGSADIVVERIESNPYILIKEVRGYGWLKADAIALKQGFTKDCKERVCAYTQYYLEEQAESNGNSWVTIEDLLTNVAAECYPVTKEDLMNWVRELMCFKDDFDKYYKDYSMGNPPKPVNEMPLLFYDPKDRRTGLFYIRLMEREIARHIQRLTEAKSTFKYDKAVCEKMIEEAEKEQGFEYTDEQVRAIWSILDNNVIVLTGSAGTGKTSTLSAVTKILKHYEQTVEQCALSGRASSLLSEVTKVSGKTIHRLLSYIPEQERFAFSESNPLHADVVILDETSMVGGELFLALISAIKNGGKFIMVGDTKQLESIGYANILKDCLSSGYIPSNELTKIHRQAARSGIISQSLRASNSEPLVHNDFIGEEIRGDLKDFKIIATTQPELVQYNIIKEFRKLFIDSKIPVEDIQVIVPMRTRGNTSCRALNEILQEIVNPNKSIKDQFVEYIDNGMKYTVCYKPGDRIIVTRNDYHALGTDRKEHQIFNGNVGYIVDISPENMVIRLQQQGDIILPRDNWSGIQLAYAITVHKKQGDSVPYAIIGFDTSAYSLYSKELVYTAITRASKYCIFVTQPKAVNAAVKISRVRIKQTWLKVDLSEFYLEKIKKVGWGV